MNVVNITIAFHDWFGYFFEFIYFLAIAHKVCLKMKNKHWRNKYKHGLKYFFI